MPGLNPQENLGETKCLCIHGGQKGSWSFSAWIHNGEMRLDEAKGRLQRAFFFLVLPRGNVQKGKHRSFLSQHQEILFHCQTS